MIHQLTPSCIAVTVPDIFKVFKIIEYPSQLMPFDESYQKLHCWIQEGYHGDQPIDFDVSLPTGNWKILGRGNELTEDQWKGIVKPNMGSFSTPTMDGYALLKSKNLAPENCLILIKKP